MDWDNIEHVKNAFVMMQNEVQKIKQLNDELSTAVSRLTDENKQLNVRIHEMELSKIIAPNVLKRTNASIDANENVKRKTKTKKFSLNNDGSSINDPPSSSTPMQQSTADAAQNSTNVAIDSNGINVGFVDLTDESKNGDWQTVTSRKGPSSAPVKSNGRKTTPIQLQKMNSDQLKKLGNELSSEVSGNEMYLHRLGENKLPRIMCDNEVAKEIVVNHLKENGIQFNSFNNAETRKKSFIVRGLICDGEDEAIELIGQSIANMGALGSIEVGKFETAYQRYHPSDDRVPLYRVTVSAQVEDQTLLDIRTIGYSRVRVERMKKSQVIQCHRCQRLHHTTGQCNFDYRCVQCTTAHPYGKCPRALNSKLPIGCVNCTESKLDSKNHTANDLKNCNYYRKMIEGQQQQLQQKQQRLQPARNMNANVKTSTNEMIGGTSSLISNAGGHSSNRSSYADATRNGMGGFSTTQIAEIIAITVKNVFSQLGNGT